MRVNLDADQRVALVRGLFSRIVPRYDLLNHLLSLGRDAFWRRAAARRAVPLNTGRFLDLACGTGDLATALARAHPRAMIYGLDFTRPMLTRAQAKLSGQDIGPRVFLAQADALDLPCPAESFDAVTMAFGIRNIPDRARALREMYRVLVPGGLALILELAFPHSPFLDRLYGTYLTRLLPWLGGLISGQGWAYHYLADSILDFPTPNEFRRLMAQAGFTRAGFIRFTFGVCVLHWGQKS